jgi:N-acetylglucosaminyldiphosphoundecaprenol N-acetyl-beta-D-mannosaminyltransferase
MKKITLVTMQLKTPGGIERFITTLAAMFSDEYQVEIVVNYGKPTDALAFPLPKNVKLTFLSPVQPQEISMKQIIKGFKWHRIPAELKRRYHINHTRNQVFKKYFSSLETDFVITDRALYNSLISKYYHGPAKKIATDHNFHQNNPKYINELLNSVSNFDALVVATKELQDFYQPKTNTKCYCIPNALSQIPKRKSTLNTKNLISVGRFVPEKDYPTLVEVMSKVHAEDPKIHLALIGDGSEKPLIKQLIKAKNLSSCITLTGWLSQDQIAKYYYDSSIFVMTSKTEAFGLVLAEAMSYGLPCIAFDRASGARAQINSKNGFLIHNTDTTKMAETILSVLNDKNQLKAIQTIINQEIEQKYSLETVKKSWQNLLN